MTDAYTLTNANRLVLVVIRRGAIITQLHVPDRRGRMADVVHGFDRPEDYGDGNPYFGATIGRVANRIAGARFELEGDTYELAMNDPDRRSHLHGGAVGWDKVEWTAATRETEAGPSIELTYVSPDGDEGYPGTVNASVTYTLTHRNALLIEMRATTDRTTLVSMAHHSYWNLGGTGSGTIEDHQLLLHATRYTPGMPPTSGGALSVVGTPFDFTEARPIGARIDQVGGNPPGYDHNFLVDGEPGQLRPFARVKDPRSGRVMALAADQPGVQFYSGNFLDGSTSGKGATHVHRSAFCLESQKVPNSIHMPGRRDEVIVRPGQVYQHRMVFQFTAE
jgi:aldose 1-epimerase